MVYKKFIESFVRAPCKPIVKLLHRFGVTPNQVTITSNIISISIFSFCFSRGQYQFNLLGLLVLVVQSYFDHVDGQLARLSGKSSKVGWWMDCSFDHITLYALILSVGYGVWRNTGSILSLWAVIFMLVGYLLISLMMVVYSQNFVGFKGIIASEELYNRFVKLQNKTIPDWLIGNLIGFWSSAARFLFGFTYIFLVGVLINKVFLCLLIITILIYIRFIAMYFVFIVFLSGKPTKSVLLNLLRDIAGDKLADKG